MPTHGYGECPRDAARPSLGRAYARLPSRLKRPPSDVKWQLDVDRFHGLHNDGSDLISNWIEKAYEVRSTSKFESFIYAWIGLNGWANCCCEVETDRVQMDLMILDEGLTENFNRLTAEGPNRHAAEKFARLWPIFKVTDLPNSPGRTRQDRPQHGGRAAVVKYYGDRWPDAVRTPNCHLNHPVGIEPDWGHTLEAIYRVRNNLFHGQKSGGGLEDKEIVDAAADILLPVAKSVLHLRGGQAGWCRFSARHGR